MVSLRGVILGATNPVEYKQIKLFLLINYDFKITFYDFFFCSTRSSRSFFLSLLVVVTSFPFAVTCDNNHLHFLSDNLCFYSFSVQCLRINLLIKV